MAARSRFSTSTVIDTEYLVPWLPGLFNPQVNLREHRYFGSPLKDAAGPLLERSCRFGFFSDNELRTPMAAYHHVRYIATRPGFRLIQNGTYQWVSREDHPSIPAREVSLLFRSSNAIITR